MAAFPSLRITSAGSEEEEEENCSAVDQQICNICLTQFAKYTCPRCNVRYCSLLCYKSEKHAQCSESFYRECFMTELQQRRGSSKEKRQMLEILKKLEEGGGDEVEGGEGTRSLEERLAGLDLENTELVWEQLTLSEKNEFQELVKSGRMGHLLSVYTPWWEVARPVVPLENPASDQSDYSIPEVLSNLPPMNSLIKDGTVSPHIHYSILNILYAYAYTVRLFNGGHHELPLQASQAVLDISGCLLSSASFSMAAEALQHAMTSVQQKRDLFNSAEFSTSVLTDVCHLLCSPKSHDSHVTRALSDLHRLFGTARRQLKATEKGAASLGAGSRQLWLAKKKLLFLTSWANENLDLLTPLTKVVEVEYETSRRDIMEQSKAENKVKRRRKEDDSKTNAEHKLIEELS